MIECKNCSVEVCMNNMPHPQKPATGSLQERNEQIIHDRAECICEICKQMQWRKCEDKELDYYCDQLISKFTDHDYNYRSTSEEVNGKRQWYIRVAGIKIPEQVLNHYVELILVRMEELGMGSVGVKDELNVCGRLERQRAECHTMVLQSIGFNGFIRTQGSNIFSRVLDNYIEREAKRRFREVDFDHWVKERLLRNRGEE